MVRDLGPGTVAHFSDGQRVHSGIVLSVSPDKKDVWALFLTSNPQWNRKARLATQDEITLCGFPQQKETFLAPVVRPVQDVSATELKFSEHRVEELGKEFGPDPFAPLVFTLPVDMYPPVRIVKPQMPKRTLQEYFSTAARKKPSGYPDQDQLEKYLTGQITLPRSELRKLLSVYPSLEEFFCRRASVTMSLQAVWERIGRILAEHMYWQKIPRKLLAMRMGLPERDVLAFESGLQCPSYQEMLTTAALLPGIPDEWSLPSSVPLMGDCVARALFHHKWLPNKAASTIRIPYNRITEILIEGARPSHEEMKRLRTICPELPPWRSYADYLDSQVDFDQVLDNAFQKMWH
jgi:hypothetical protein